MSLDYAGEKLYVAVLDMARSTGSLQERLANACLSVNLGNKRVFRHFGEIGSSTRQRRGEFRTKGPFPTWWNTSAISDSPKWRKTRLILTFTCYAETSHHRRSSALALRVCSGLRGTASHPPTESVCAHRDQPAARSQRHLD
jgi:hypothetical protein